MFSLSWYLVGGLVALGVGILIGFELADKEHQRSIERLKQLYQGNVKTLADMLAEIRKDETDGSKQ